MSASAKTTLVLGALILASCGDSHPPESRPTPAPTIAPAQPVSAASTAPAPTPAPVAPPTTLVRTITTPLSGENLALGRPYTMSQAPNYELCTDPDDIHQLTDGAFAQDYFWTDKRTVGWTNTPRIDIVVDLGSSQPIGTIAIDTAGGCKATALAGVGLPDAWFLVSDDGVAFHQVAAFHGYGIPDLPDTYVRRYTAGNLAVSGRYVAVALVPNGPFAFIDEIEVMRGTSVAPATAPSLTMAQLGQQIDNQRGEVIARLGAERSSATQRATIRANLMAAGGSAAAALTSLAQATGDLPWMQANARAAASRFPGQDLIAWQRNIWDDYTACDLPPAGAATATTLGVVMGSDEYETTGFAMTNATADPLRITASVGDLHGSDGSIPAKNLTVRIDAFNDCRDGIQRPDALPLLDQDGAIIEPGCTRQIWVSVHATGQTAGIYRGELALNLPSGRRIFPIAAEVVPVRLPNPLPLATLDWGYLSFAPCKADPDAAIRDRAAHRINTAVLENATLPQFRVGADGSLISSDFTAFDATVQRYRAAGIDRFNFFINFGDSYHVASPLGCNVISPRGIAIGSPTWKTALTAITTTWIQHCLDIGLAQDHIAFYPFDEPSDKLFPEAIPVWSAIKAADPRARCFVTVPENTLPALQSIAKDIDIWCPHQSRVPGHQLSPEKQDFFRERQARGSAFWLYNCDGPDKSFPPLAHYRHLLWQAWDMGATGVGLWNYADTGYDRFASAWTDLDGAREDFALIYDAATAPAGVSRREAQIPSRRWEAFRDGIEDYAYLWSLRQAVSAARGSINASTLEAVLRDVTAMVSAAPATATSYATAHERLLRTLARAGTVAK